MQNLDLVGMFTLGLFGTGHCIGMCGPLVFALPGRSGRFMSHVWYHLGRVITYVAVGGLLGGGAPLVARLTGMETTADVAGLQAVIRFLAAALLLLFGLNRLGWLREPRWLARMTPERLPGFRTAIEGSTSSRGQGVFLYIGLVLGLLPCGLSYGAFAQALGTGSAAAGALLVLAFAAGTVPGLLTLGTGVAAFVQRHRRISELIAGILMLFMAGMMVSKAWRAL
jgi:hypothetical protein